ncbi:hypothetical protein [Paeniglutamicibacter terrestris]|uniref:Terminase n=1 Tax=Paeniglutamicibacter terrestris TaxID=2723403 RepID=A0ABX1G516_9MICC|nr:hypothetical protein [Paeniglutamicibacter terrestris]NKG21098.1 hypothetical protein [Paeniglutamicibacter terrestris]
MAVRGNQVPRFNTAPSPAGFNIDDGQDAVFYASKFGLIADPWQETTCEAWMRRCKDGRWCAPTWVVTVPRQNGKNGALEIVELYGMAELGLKFLHTAHEVKTARKAFVRLKYFFGDKPNEANPRFPELNAMVREVRSTNGQEAIVLHNGGQIEFVARSKGSARGFTVDVLVLDEAQELQDEQLEALLPTISAAPSGNPVTIYMGTPPDAAELEKGIGEPFVRVRKNAIEGIGAVAWVEFSARAYVEDMTDIELEAFVRMPKHHADANPAYNIRILPSTIDGELVQFSARSFARERLNMWPRANGKPTIFPPGRWSDLGIDPEDTGDWPLAAIGVDMNIERTQVSIHFSSFTETGVCLELVAQEPFNDGGTQALVDFLWTHAKRNRPVVIQGFSQAKTLVPHLLKKKMMVRVLSGGEWVEACMNFYDDVTVNKTIVHFGEPRVDASFAGFTRDIVNKETGIFKFGRVDLTVDMSPGVSATCAHFGAIKFARQVRPGGSDSSGKRSAIVAN